MVRDHNVAGVIKHLELLLYKVDVNEAKLFYQMFPKLCPTDTFYCWWLRVAPRSIASGSPLAVTKLHYVTHVMKTDHLWQLGHVTHSCSCQMCCLTGRVAVPLEP